MYKTPVNERKRRSVMKTPVVVLGTSVVEPSVLNTPEEPGKVFFRREKIKIHFAFSVIKLA